MIRLHLGTRKGLFTLDRVTPAAGRPRWEISGVSFLANEVPMLLPDHRDGSLYAALHHGHFGEKLHRSPDGGKTWEEITAPAFPPLAEGEEPWICAFRNIPVPNTLQLIWSLEPGGADQPGRLWCGGVPAGLFRSDDYGKSWELVRPLWDLPERRKWVGGGLDYAGIHSICVHPTDPDRVLVGISCGGVWGTEDGGRSWQIRSQGMRAEYMPPELQYDPNAQDPHRVVQCRSAPAVLYTQHHNGIFRSTDHSHSWTEVTTAKPSGFGFAVAVDPNDPKTAWFVPAVKDEQRIPAHGQVVVSRTRDGGESFEVLREGLPQEHAYDIVFRHALDVDSTGRVLAFGSTTGSLWISENAGDSWQCLSNHLPPIYCVRFGEA